MFRNHRILSSAVLTLATIVCVLPACSLIVHEYGGAFDREPEELTEMISPEGAALIKKAFTGIEDQPVLDYHTHIIGLGTSCEECFVHSSFTSFYHPLQRFKFAVYMSASGIEDADQTDDQFVERLARMMRSFGKKYKSAILALDKHYNEDGRVDIDKTQFYVPNSYVYDLSRKYPDLFIPVISVHPYRKDALEELEHWAARGVKMVKWLPNAMGIDPSLSRNDAFYEIMKRYDMVLLSHVGHEQAVGGEAEQELGNPQRLRRPLDHGVTVIMAHCASLGTCRDLDNPDLKKNNVACFDLFLKMTEEKRYEQLLYGDISAMLQTNRLPQPIMELLRRPDLSGRLVNGTDYPLIAINSLIRTKDLVKNGLITKEERQALNDIYEYNPLLFEFVAKRTIRLPGTNQGLPASIFTRDILTQRSGLERE